MVARRRRSYRERVTTTPPPPPDYARLLDLPLFAHVAVTMPSGKPRSYPMWFLWEDGLLRFTNTDSRPQTRALQDRPVLALSILDPDEPYRYLGVAASVVDIVPDPTGAMYDRLAQRYGTDMRPADPSDRVVITARPTGYWSQ
jgi:PPOX class probable F420-dependent enzyme